MIARLWAVMEPRKASLAPYPERLPKPCHRRTWTTNGSWFRIVKLCRKSLFHVLMLLIPKYNLSFRFVRSE